MIQNILFDQLSHYPCEAINLAPQSGNIGNLYYQVSGKGQPLVLFPQLIAPAQWEVLLPFLNQHFTVILLSGCDIGSVGHLEDRARDATWSILQKLLMTAGIQSGQCILDLSCGAGALLKRMLPMLHDNCHIIGLDHNPFLCRSRDLI